MPRRSLPVRTRNRSGPVFSSSQSAGLRVIHARNESVGLGNFISLLMSVGALIYRLVVWDVYTEAVSGNPINLRHTIQVRK